MRERWLDYLRGFASIGLFPDVLPPNDIEKRTPYEALADDWAAIGADMRAAMAKIDAEIAAKAAGK